jgi:molecular chaperone HscB
MPDYFQLFGLKKQFQIDLTELDAVYRVHSSVLHPDKFAHSSAAEQALSLMKSTELNSAYQTLKHPLARARYLLSLQGIDTEEESNTAMPMDFLMAQMTWREEIAEAANNLSELEKIAQRLQIESASYQQPLTEVLDTAFDAERASVLVRQLQFMNKLQFAVADAINQNLY